jgi:hypothetical protein
MTEEQKKMADEIVAYYKRTNGIKTSKEILFQEFQLSYPKREIGYVVNILNDKGMLECADGVVKQYFYLSHKGWQYESYNKLLEKERLETEIKSRKDTIDLKNAERVYKSYPITRFAAWFGAISGIILLLLKLAEVLDLLPLKK